MAATDPVEIYRRGWEEGQAALRQQAEQWADEALKLFSPQDAPAIELSPVTVPDIKKGQPITVTRFGVTTTYIVSEVERQSTGYEVWRLFPAIEEQ